MLRELLEVERLVRAALEELKSSTFSGECNETHEEDCGHVIRIKHKCAKCGDEAEVDVTCSGSVEVDCDGEVTLTYDDAAEGHLIRELELALVQLDLSRARQGEPQCV